MKFLTGNEKIKCRGLFQLSEITFKPQFKLALLCNDKPEMDKNDAGVWSRCRVINFPTTFVENPQDINEKKMDKNLQYKMINWKADFMLLLLEYYKKYVIYGLPMTECIKQQTLEYKHEQDMYKRYLDERTEKSATHVKFVTLYDDFKQWYVENNPSMKIPSSRIFQVGIKRYIKIEKNVKFNNIPTTGIKYFQLKLLDDINMVYDSS